MKADSKNSTLAILIPILSAIFIAKALWVGASYYLPKSSVDKEYKSEVEPLYYRYSLASKKAAPKPIIVKKKKIKRVKKAPPKPRNLEVKKFSLKGIYYSKSKKIATIEYKGKTYVLEPGEEIKGFKLAKVMPNYVIFTKDKEKYRLDIFKEEKKNKPPRVVTPQREISTTPKPVKKEKKQAVYQEGDTTIISKEAFDKYRKNIKDIRRYIGGVPIIKNNKLKGFRISYIKKGSDFDRVGLKRGDIIIAINGEEITDLSVPMRFMNNIDSISAATITVKRGNEVKELEYEVR